jgi:preprotein translocase subunit SecE
MQRVNDTTTILVTIFAIVVVISLVDWFFNS